MLSPRAPWLPMTASADGRTDLQPVRRQEGGLSISWHLLPHVEDGIVPSNLTQGLLSSWADLIPTHHVGRKLSLNFRTSNDHTGSPHFIPGAPGWLAQQRDRSSILLCLGLYNFGLALGSTSTTIVHIHEAGVWLATAHCRTFASPRKIRRGPAFKFQRGQAGGRAQSGEPWCFVSLLPVFCHCD